MDGEKCGWRVFILTRVLVRDPSRGTGLKQRLVIDGRYGLEK